MFCFSLPLPQDTAISAAPAIIMESANFFIGIEFVISNKYKGKQ
jgi:hypothetical protein